MSTRTKRAFGGTALVLLAVLFVALIMLSNVMLRGVRLDLTENQLYTISEGTRNILGDLDEPINLYFYFSDRGTADVPFLRAYATRVQEMLEEFVLHSDGKLQLNVIDPLPFSEEEDDAARFGLQAIPIGSTGETIYFGLAGTNSVDDEQAIAFFEPDKEAFLEYDVARMIYTLDNPKLPVIGLLSSLPMSAGFDPMSQRMREPWAVSSQIDQLFEVRQLDATLSDIDEDIDLLLVVHPKMLGDATLYAIDQFVMGGGNLLVFVDPHSEADTPPQDPSNPAAAMMAQRSSTLGKLFTAWGIDYDDQQVLLDASRALAVNAAPGRPPARHLALLGLNGEDLDGDDVTTAALGSINVGFAGVLGVSEGSALTLEALIESSADSMVAPADRFRFLSDPAELLDGFTPGGERRVIAARFTGVLDSAFPGGFEPPVPDTEDDDAEEQQPPAPAGHIERAAAPVNLIVVADTDMLTDRFWVQVQNFFGQRLLSAFANNGDFVVNALDNLTGSSDLISIRGRATFSRPFERVEALKREADARFRATEQRLQDELRATEAKLSELQSERQSGDNLLILTDAQRAEIEQFQRQKLRIRDELREVRRSLDRDIENLGTLLKVVNIALVPVLLTVLALLAVWLRHRRQRGEAR